MPARFESARPAPRMSPVPLVHASVAAFVLSPLFTWWVAHEKVSAWAHVETMAGLGALYVAVWLVARLEWGPALIAGGLAVCGGLAAALFLTQYRFIEGPDKLPVLDAIGRAMSAPFPRIGLWHPFPNSLGTLLDGLLLAAAGTALSRRRPQIRVAASVAVVVMSVAVIVSASRGSWLAVLLASAGAVLAWVRIPKPPAGWVAAAALLLVVAVIAPSFDGRPWWLRLAEASGRVDRLEVYEHSLTLLADAPFTGIGAGNQFAATLSKYALLIQVPFLTYAHNLVLDVWLEHGLGGLVAWVMLAAATVTIAVAGERAGAGWRFRGLWAGVLAIHLHGLVDARQSVDAWTWVPFFVLTAALAGHASRHRLRARPGWAAAPVVAGLTVALAVLVGRGAPVAAWRTNLGAVAQTNAELGTTDNASSELRYAQRLFQEALQAVPSDAPTLRRLGVLELSEDRHADAANHLRRAWVAQPWNRTSAKAYGLAAMWTGDVETAAQLLASVPNVVDELNAWSSWRTTRGEVDLALAAARTSLALGAGQTQVRERIEALERQQPRVRDASSDGPDRAR